MEQICLFSSSRLGCECDGLARPSWAPSFGLGAKYGMVGGEGQCCKYPDAAIYFSPLKALSHEMEGGIKVVSRKGPFKSNSL